MKVITVANRKGGTGKTTTTYNLAFSLALKGKRVCLVDLDTQSNLSLISKVKPISIEAFKDAEIQKMNNFIDILPSTKDFSILENEINNMIDRNSYLKTSILPKIENHANYDYVLIDTSPSFSILNINAFCITDIVLVVINSDFFSVSGLNEIISVINQVRDINKKLDYKIILNNFVKNRKYFDSLEPILQGIPNYTDIRIPNRQAFIDNSSLYKPSIDIDDVGYQYDKICEVIA